MMASIQSRVSFLLLGSLLGSIALGSAHAQSASNGLASYAIGAEPKTQWKLPNRLDELSGLATTPDGRLLGHDDEKALISEIDYETGELVKSWALGYPTVQEDFEGIAVADSQVYLITSSGRLYESVEGNDGDRLLYSVHELGLSHGYSSTLGRRCEIEGLEFEPSDNTLLILCKTHKIAELSDLVTIFRWSVDQRSVVEDGTLQIPLDRFTVPLGERRFQPSGIARDPRTGNYYLVAAIQKAIAEITPAGEVVAVKSLSKDHHRQAEGIAVAADGTLIIGDEGGRKRARLTLYPPSN